MAGGGGAAVGDLALDPEVGVAGFDVGWRTSLTRSRTVQMRRSVGRFLGAVLWFGPGVEEQA